MSPMLFKDRELVVVQPSHPDLKHFGVALDNEEAQELLNEECRVFGDERGPYLVVRVPAGVPMPFPIQDVEHVDVEVQPREWTIGNGGNGRHGVICYLRSIQ